jgi:acyl-coenzyme A thioesterase PaaI-like protein
MATAAEKVRARTQNVCVVCGSENRHGLRIDFETAADGSVRALWTPSPGWEGFEGIVHGGIIATVLDEAMSKAVAWSGSEALTAELRVRYRHHVCPGDRLVIKGWIADKSRRLMQTEAVVETEDGCERAHAWAKFLSLYNPG